MKPSDSKKVERSAPAGGKPPRAMPWPLLTAFAVVALAAGVLGALFGGRIVGAVRAMTGPADSSGGGVTTAGHDHAGGGEAQFYTCGMHPWVILPKPGDCPICHMALTPLDPSKFTGEVSIDPVVVQNIGVRIKPVEEGPLVRSIRTVGTVDYDETRVRDVNTKISGWIERLYLDSVGAPVKEGDPLFEVYSPALFQAQEEFLLALRRARAGTGAPDGGREQPLDLVESARTKLELYDITPEQIDALAKAGKPSRTMTVLSPHTGVVIAKHANEGMNVDPGMQVFRIADLSRVWVIVTLYESQLPFVSEGQRAVMTLPYIPGQTFEGRIVYIYPYLDTRTHEVQLRLEFENESGLLKPGMFATVELKSTLKREAVLAPRSAVISTGERNMAFVSLGEGKFEPRQVRLGVETGEGKVEILGGLKPGEMVVTSGQFLLDSESRVRESLAKMIRGELAADQQVQVATAGRSEVDSLPEEVAAGLAESLEHYFALGERLAADSAAGLTEPARGLAAALDKAIGVAIPGDEHFWHRHTEAAVARGAALELVGSGDLESARESYAELSVALDELVRATGVPPRVQEEVQSLHCPMFREGQGGATWLQRAGPVRNPFFGAMMLECYDRREALPVTGQAGPAEEEGGEPAAVDPEPVVQEVSPEAQEALDAVVAAYLAVQEHLTKDDAESAAGAIGRMKGALPALAGLEDAPGEAVEQITGALEAPGDDLEALRATFGTVSDALLVITEAVPPSSSEGGLYHAYCPMVKQHWLQTGEGVRNPYDPRMLKCGRIEGRVDREVAP